jgi:predicted Zn-dependent protease
MQVSTVFPRTVLLSVLGLIVCLPLAIKATWQKARRPAPQSASQIRRANATGSLKIITGQPGSVVFINGVRHGVTSDKGELELPHAIAGSYSIRVQTLYYVDWNGAVVIAAGATRLLKIPQLLREKDAAVLEYQNGEALRDKGRNKEAVKYFQSTLTWKPSFPEAHIALARSLIMLQDFQEAEKHIQTAIKLAGRTLVEAQTVLANLRRAQGLVDESIVEYRKALRIARGNSFEAHIGLAIALNEQGKNDEAVKEYRIGIIQDMETEPILYYQLGEILEKAGRNKEAIDAYRSYLRLDPEGEYASAVESIIQRLKEENR